MQLDNSNCIDIPIFERNDSQNNPYKKIWFFKRNESFEENQFFSSETIRILINSEWSQIMKNLQNLKRSLLLIYKNFEYNHYQNEEYQRVKKETDEANNEAILVVKNILQKNGIEMLVYESSVSEIFTQMTQISEMFFSSLYKPKLLSCSQMKISVTSDSKQIDQMMEDEMEQGFLQQQVLDILSENGVYPRKINFICLEKIIVNRKVEYTFYFDIIEKQTYEILRKNQQFMSLGRRLFNSLSLRHQDISYNFVNIAIFDKNWYFALAARQSPLDKQCSIVYRITGTWSNNIDEVKVAKENQLFLDYCTPINSEVVNHMQVPIKRRKDDFQKIDTISFNSFEYEYYIKIAQQGDNQFQFFTFNQSQNLIDSRCLHPQMMQIILIQKYAGSIYDVPERMIEQESTLNFLQSQFENFPTNIHQNISEQIDQQFLNTQQQNIREQLISIQRADDEYPNLQQLLQQLNQDQQQSHNLNTNYFKENPEIAKDVDYIINSFGMCNLESIILNNILTRMNKEELDLTQKEAELNDKDNQLIKKEQEQNINISQIDREKAYLKEQRYNLNEKREQFDEIIKNLERYLYQKSFNFQEINKFELKQSIFKFYQTFLNLPLIDHITAIQQLEQKQELAVREYETSLQNLTKQNRPVKPKERRIKQINLIYNACISRGRQLCFIEDYADIKLKIDFYDVYKQFRSLAKEEYELIQNIFIQLFSIYKSGDVFKYKKIILTNLNNIQQNDITKEFIQNRSCEFLNVQPDQISIYRYKYDQEKDECHVYFDVKDNSIKRQIENLIIQKRVSPNISILGNKIILPLRYLKSEKNDVINSKPEDQSRYNITYYPTPVQYQFSTGIRRIYCQFIGERQEGKFDIKKKNECKVDQRITFLEQKNHLQGDTSYLRDLILMLNKAKYRLEERKKVNVTLLVQSIIVNNNENLTLNDKQLLHQTQVQGQIRLKGYYIKPIIQDLTKSYKFYEFNSKGIYDPDWWLIGWPLLYRSVYDQGDEKGNFIFSDNPSNLTSSREKQLQGISEKESPNIFYICSIDPRFDNFQIIESTHIARIPYYYCRIRCIIVQREGQCSIF